MTSDSRPSLPIRAAKVTKEYAVLAIKRYRRLHIYSKLFIWFLVCFYIALTVVILYLKPARIAQWMYDGAHALSLKPYGWLVILGIMVVISFPPMIGHATTCTLCGFAYGMKGFILAAGGSLLGSAIAFIVLRLLFSRRLHQWSAKSEKWQALESVVRAKGLPLIILIRMSPLPPWVYSNTLFSSIEPVKLWQFFIATLFVFPKVTIHVFIGWRAASLADGEQRDQMDMQTKLINSALIIGGTLFTIFMSWFVYRLVQGHIRKLEGISPRVDELAAEALGDYDEEAPLLSSTSPRDSLEVVEEQH